MPILTKVNGGQCLIPRRNQRQTRDEMLSALEGLINSVLRDPLADFALNDLNASVREQAVDSLRRFVSDPNIEALL